jgi:hypothetical protein
MSGISAHPGLECGGRCEPIGPIRLIGLENIGLISRVQCGS